MKWLLRKRTVAEPLADVVPVLPRLHEQLMQVRRDLQRLCADIVAVGVALERAESNLVRLHVVPELIEAPKPTEFTHENRQRAEKVQ
jgi:hypothetical protein